MARSSLIIHHRYISALSDMAECLRFLYDDTIIDTIHVRFAFLDAGRY